MTLGELIDELERHNPRIVVKEGFDNPHSYRGWYDRLAFQTASSISIGDMLQVARGALGSTFYGWKGGEYVMREWTECYLANPGELGEELGVRLLRYMLAEVEDLA